VKETRCLGLWAGVELVPEAGGARKYCYALKDRGLLCKDTHVNTIRLAPGRHTVRIVVRADADPRSAGRRIEIQRAVVYAAR
jgi:acetylornithine/succinyldiaminopimelate/putrescine aminotransferase